MNDMEQLLRKVSLGRLANEWRRVKFENPERWVKKRPNRKHFPNTP
jgi:hypothetical protein